MNISTISYWFYEAFESMKKNMKNVLISVTTMIATMLLIAVSYMIVRNVDFVVTQKQEETSVIRAYMEFDASEDRVEPIKTRLLGIDGVKSVTYVSKEEAIKNTMEYDSTLLAGYSYDVLINEICQAYFNISFNEVDAQAEIISTLKNLDGIGKEDIDIQVPVSAVHSIKVAQSIGIIALLAMILIIYLSVFLMMNSTKLVIYARRKEISIMKYVGAKDTFIKVPFAIEGIIVALIAAIIVLILVSFLYAPLTGIITSKANYSCLALDEIMGGLRIILLSVGAIIGIFGSTISMNKYLDV